MCLVNLHLALLLLCRLACFVGLLLFWAGDILSGVVGGTPFAVPPP
jgi:hypothetical protein